MKKIIGLLFFIANFIGMQAIAGNLNLTQHLTSHVTKNVLVLLNQHVTDNDMPAIVKFLENHPEIIGLSISNFDPDDLGPQSAKLLAQNTTLTSLELTLTHIGDEG